MFVSFWWVAKRWSAVNYLSGTVPFLVALPNINHWTELCVCILSSVSIRVHKPMSLDCIQNVTSIINVISKVIVVDACNWKNQKKSQHRTLLAKQRAVRTAFFFWNKTSDIFLLIIFICACVIIVHVYVISLTVRHAIDVLDTWKYHSLSLSLALYGSVLYSCAQAAREKICIHRISFAWYAAKEEKEHFFFLLHKMNGCFFSLILLLSFCLSSRASSLCSLVLLIFVLLAFRLAHQSYLFM